MSEKTGLIVSIGVCVRNCEGAIGEVINSILDQDFPHGSMEVIFVDDGSEDATLEIIHDSIPRLDFRFKIFSGCWKGLGAARQTVVDNACGPYIVWFDCGMRLSRRFIRYQVEFMEKNPLAGVAKGTYGMTSEDSLISTLEELPFAVFYRKYSGKPIEKFPGSGGSIYRVSAVREVGGFDRCIKGAAEDVDLEYRIKSTGWLIYATSAIFYVKRPAKWGDLLRKYLWYGYGMHYVLHKNPRAERLYEMFPLVAFLEGFLHSLSAYRQIHKKFVFLLPLHFYVKMTVWFFGFIRAHVDSYGHEQCT